MISIKFHGRIPQRDWLRKVVRALEQATRIDHPLVVHFTTLHADDLGGLFLLSKPLSIWIATRPPPQVCEEEWWHLHIPLTLAHELAHYEQFRDGKKMTERGVEVRARSLLLAAGRTAPDFWASVARALGR